MIKHLTTISVLCLIVFSFFSCKDSKVEKTGKTDLMKYGIPYAVKAPTDVSITHNGTGKLTDVSLQNKNGYDVQVFMSEAYTKDTNKLKQQKKEMITGNPYFSKIVEEYEDGFLYEKRSDDASVSYDFILIKIVGEKEINFQCGNSKAFSEAEVKNMIKTIAE